MSAEEQPPGPTLPNPPAWFKKDTFDQARYLFGALSQLRQELDRLKAETNIVQVDNLQQDVVSLQNRCWALEQNDMAINTTLTALQEEEKSLESASVSSSRTPSTDDLRKFKARYFSEQDLASMTFNKLMEFMRKSHAKNLMFQPHTDANGNIKLHLTENDAGNEYTLAKFDLSPKTGDAFYIVKMINRWVAANSSTLSKYEQYPFPAAMVKKQRDLILTYQGQLQEYRNMNETDRKTKRRPKPPPLLLWHEFDANNNVNLNRVNWRQTAAFARTVNLSIDGHSIGDPSNPAARDADKNLNPVKYNNHANEYKWNDDGYDEHGAYIGKFDLEQNRNNLYVIYGSRWTI